MKRLSGVRKKRTDLDLLPWTSEGKIKKIVFKQKKIWRTKITPQVYPKVAHQQSEMSMLRRYKKCQQSNIAHEMITAEMSSYWTAKFQNISFNNAVLTENGNKSTAICLPESDLLVMSQLFLRCQRCHIDSLCNIYHLHPISLAFNHVNIYQLQVFVCKVLDNLKFDLTIAFGKTSVITSNPDS